MPSSEFERLSETALAYDKLLVPALFQPLAKIIAKEIKLTPGSRILDVGCGTGALIQELISQSSSAHVEGVDANPGMLAIARQNLPSVSFHEGAAESLPFGNSDFDAVVSQFALMLFEDRERSLKEMWRVLKPGGQLVVAVFDEITNNKAYAKIANCYENIVGPDIANALRIPFSMGNAEELKNLVQSTTFTPVELKTAITTAQFKSATHLAQSDIQGWFPFAGLQVSNAKRDAIIVELESEFEKQLISDGSIAFEVAAHIATASKK